MRMKYVDDILLVLAIEALIMGLTSHLYCRSVDRGRSLTVRTEADIVSKAKVMLLQYTVKKVTDFPVPSGDVTNQILPGRE